MLDPTTKLVLATLDDCIRSSPLRRKRIIDRVRECAAEQGGNASYRYWLSRYDDWFAEERRHHPPTQIFTFALEDYGSAPWLDPWLSIETRMQREARLHIENGRMRSVRPEPSRHRGTA